MEIFNEIKLVTEEADEDGRFGKNLHFKEGPLLFSGAGSVNRADFGWKM
jgi:hypothetical protein